MTYTKLPISITDQITLLKSRELIFADEAYAAKVLEHISYYRFAAYLRPMESDKATHQMHTGASFEKAFALYIPIHYTHNTFLPFKYFSASYLYDTYIIQGIAVAISLNLSSLELCSLRLSKNFMFQVTI